MQPRPKSAPADEPFKRRWSDYYQAVEGRPPRDTLLFALNQFNALASDAMAKSLGESLERSLWAVDLGCGDGRDTVELLRQGWRVLAIDGETDAINRLRQRADIDRMLLETRVQRFEALTLPPAVDLINASFCLPFCPPNWFSDLWEEIVVALKPHGRFCGHLFGNRDSWATYPDLTHHTRHQVEQLLAPFDVELLDEEDHPGKTALGEEKHWHIFNIVARKI